jgi:hypothetical protein
MPASALSQHSYIRVKHAYAVDGRMQSCLPHSNDGFIPHRGKISHFLLFRSPMYYVQDPVLKSEVTYLSVASPYHIISSTFVVDATLASHYRTCNRSFSILRVGL